MTICLLLHVRRLKSCKKMADDSADEYFFGAAEIQSATSRIRRLGTAGISDSATARNLMDSVARHLVSMAPAEPSGNVSRRQSSPTLAIDECPKTINENVERIHSLVDEMEREILAATSRKGVAAHSLLPPAQAPVVSAVDALTLQQVPDIPPKRRGSRKTVTSFV